MSYCEAPPYLVRTDPSDTLSPDTECRRCSRRLNNAEVSAGMDLSLVESRDLMGAGFSSRVDPPQCGRQNMETDLRLLEEADRSLRPRTLLRLYRWQPPTVSVGRHQDAERAFNLDYCRQQGIPWVRRPSGGRAVYHCSELTYSFVSNHTGLLSRGSISSVYAWVAARLVDALKNLGVVVEAARGKGTQLREPSRPDLRRQPCFVAVSRSEIVYGGRKLVGSAQRRLRRSFLQHGAIPLVIDYQMMARVLGVAEVQLRERMTSVSEAAPQPIDFDSLAESLISAFCRALRP
jgi:lipoate-protein ligase A